MNLYLNLPMLGERIEYTKTEKNGTHGGCDGEALEDKSSQFHMLRLNPSYSCATLVCQDSIVASKKGVQSHFPSIKPPGITEADTTSGSTLAPEAGPLRWGFYVMGNPPRRSILHPNNSSPTSFASGASTRTSRAARAEPPPALPRTSASYNSDSGHGKA
ncbi:hypothetical protein M405DRAFT_846772 [Rhizopogon salebrosus TDB-379]|nr:hypothetical protein M405DRAFT_846772 [Rhizopogon salebrosus TDB-379]